MFLLRGNINAYKRGFLIFTSFTVSCDYANEQADHLEILEYIIKQGLEESRFQTQENTLFITVVSALDLGLVSNCENPHFLFAGFELADGALV